MPQIHHLGGSEGNREGDVVEQDGNERVALERRDATRIRPA